MAKKKGEDNLDIEFHEEEIIEKGLNEKKKNKKNNNLGKTLVILVIILIIIDGLSLYYYFNKNSPKDSKDDVTTTGKAVSTSKKCEDGTAYDQCSKNLPFFCYDGALIKKAALCGCPEGYKASFQNCVKI
jgi:hypothetical protein